MAIAVLNLLFALTLLVVAFMVTRKIRNLSPMLQIAAYAPAATICAIVIVMMLFAAYLFCGGSPSFR
jgi:hypothetical protein